LRYALFMLLFEALLVAGFGMQSDVGAVANSTSYPSGSWGLGVVIPEGSQFSDGDTLSWSSTRTLTANVQLPNMSYTDNTILAVLSAMAADGAVLQVAAGIYPNMSNWLAYGWFIQSPESNPQTYAWVLNSSRPEMTSGALISLSIYISYDGWMYKVEDTTTHEGVNGKFPFNVTRSFKVGDQEVFALESYSHSTNVFEHMGSLVLSTLLVGGRMLTKGPYFYGDWDTTHNPLFVVGGLNPPSFISMNSFANGTVTWTYSEWTGSGQPFQINFPVTTVFAGLLAVGAISAIIGALTIKKRTTSYARTFVR
jgi:hypothetical protein